MVLPGFAFAGYDLLDTDGLNSALLNCGRFPKAFRRQDLNPVGLLDTHAQAGRIRVALRDHYPDNQHADCRIWALWRRN